MFPLILLLRIEATKLGTGVNMQKRLFALFPLILLLRIEATQKYLNLPEDSVIGLFPLILLLRIEATRIRLINSSEDICFH